MKTGGKELANWLRRRGHQHPVAGTARRGRDSPGGSPAKKAIERGYGAYFVRACDLMEDLRKARAEHNLDRRLRVRLAPKVLAVDEFGIWPYDRDAAASSRWSQPATSGAASSSRPTKASARGAVLAQAATPGRGHELEAAKEVLGLVPLQGRAVVAEALLTQREVCEQIAAGGGDYLLPVKGNQPTLYQDLAEAFSPNRS